MSGDAGHVNNRHADPEPCATVNFGRSAILDACSLLTPALFGSGAIEEFVAGNEEVRLRIERLRMLQRQINISAFGPQHPIHNYICPINRSLMMDPVTADDGRNYDRRNIEMWIASRQDVGGNGVISPISRESMGISLTPNLELRERIQEVRLVRLAFNPHAIYCPNEPCSHCSSSLVYGHVRSRRCGCSGASCVCVQSQRDVRDARRRQGHCARCAW